MCRVLGVHRSGYYAWAAAAISPRASANKQLLAEIKAFYLQSGGVYGSPRIYRDCKAAGLACSENRVARLMHRARLFAVRGYRKARHLSGKPAIASPKGCAKYLLHKQPMSHGSQILRKSTHTKAGSMLQ